MIIQANCDKAGLKRCVTTAGMVPERPDLSKAQRQIGRGRYAFSASLTVSVLFGPERET
jgi:hypothetical protein